MKNMKYMVVALVAAIALLGVGYAQWSDSVAMDYNVSTGKMDVQVVGITTANPMSYNKWLNTNVQWDANTAYVTISDLYPGAMGRVDVKFENKGTMPIDLNSVQVQHLDGDRALFDKLVGRVSTTYNTKGAIGTTGTVTEYVGHNAIASQAFLDMFKTKLDNVVILPGGQLSFAGENDEEDCIQIQLPADAGNEYQQKWTKFKITFNFDQTLPPEHSGQPVPAWWVR